MLSDFESALTKMESGSLPIVLTGEANNSTMCAGLDLAYLFGCDKSVSKERTFAVLSRLGLCVERLHVLPRPVVAALSGHALAGGLSKEYFFFSKSFFLPFEYIRCCDFKCM
jgi:enoyl-CoA hydratase